MTAAPLGLDAAEAISEQALADHPECWRQVWPPVEPEPVQRDWRGW